MNMNNNSILISKDINNSPLIYNMIETTRKIDSMVIDSFDGYYKATEVAISLYEDKLTKLYNETYLINKLSLNEIKNILIK